MKPTLRVDYCLLWKGHKIKAAFSRYKYKSIQIKEQQQEEAISSPLHFFDKKSLFGLKLYYKCTSDITAAQDLFEAAFRKRKKTVYCNFNDLLC